MRIQYKDIDEFVKFILLAAESSFNGCPNKILLYHLGNCMIWYNISDFLLIYWFGILILLLLLLVLILGEWWFFRKNESVNALWIHQWIPAMILFLYYARKKWQFNPTFLSWICYLGCPSMGFQKIYIFTFEKKIFFKI